MPIIPGTSNLSNNDPIKTPFFARRVFTTDKDGVEHEITSEAQLQAILDQMTPEQRKDWETRYRFASVINLTGLINYTGTGMDL